MIHLPGPTPKRPRSAARRRPARRLVEASVSPNTRRAYAGALRRLDAWLDGRPLHDVTRAAYLAELHDAGRASSSASMAVAAACFRAKLAGQLVLSGSSADSHPGNVRRSDCTHQVRGTNERHRHTGRPYCPSGFVEFMTTAWVHH